VAGEVEPFLLATRSGIRGNLSVNYIAFGIIVAFTRKKSPSKQKDR